VIEPTNKSIFPKNLPKQLSLGQLNQVNQNIPGVSPVTEETFPDGSMEITFGEEESDILFQEGEHYENLSYLIDEEILTEISFDVIDAYEADKESRSDWEHTIAEGVKSLGLDPHADASNYGISHEGMCTATHPLLIESAVKFQSKFTAEMLPAKGPARTQIVGSKTDEKEARAQRVQQHLNYQLTVDMPEYADEMDKVGFHLPLYGSAFKKMYWDITLGRPAAEFVHIDDFVVSENAKSLETAERYTHIIEKTPVQLQMDIDAGVYTQPDGEYDLEGGTGETGEVKTAEEEVTGQAPTHSLLANTVHTLYEQHVYMALPEDIDGGLILPYVVTVDSNSGSILSVRRNWSKDDPKKQMRQWFTHYRYVPGFGFHGLGLIHLLGDMHKTLTVVMRSLVDAGQYANLQGGFRLKGTKMLGDKSPIRMGEFRVIETTLQDLSKTIMPLPFKEPSATLYQLLEYLTGASQKFADSTEQVIQDSSNYGPVGTTMALLEASVKFFSAIHKRAHRAQGKELKILAQLNYEFLSDQYPYEVPGADQKVLRADYDPKSVDVIPASDPNITSQAHRISLAQSKLQAALQAPQLHNLREVFKDFYIALGVDDIDSFLLQDVQAQPLGPMEDILAANKGMPISAFPGQNHEAHVQFKMAWLQDPTQGGSGMFNNIIPAIQANMREHQLMTFQEKIQVQPTGAATDQKTQEMVQAEAAKSLAQTNQLMAEEKAEGGPAGMVAKAELMKATADLMKEERENKEGQAELILKFIEALNAIEREKTRAAEAGRKFEFEEEKLAAKLLKEMDDGDREDRKHKADLAMGRANMFQDNSNKAKDREAKTQEKPKG